MSRARCASPRDRAGVGELAMQLHVQRHGCAGVAEHPLDRLDVGTRRNRPLAEALRTGCENNIAN